MTEARLEIKPTVVGDARRQLSPIRTEMQRFEHQSSKSLISARRDAQRLGRAYDAMGSGIGRATKGLGGLTRGLFSLQSLAVGAATGFAGRTAVDLLIGSNERLESQRLTFRTLIGDAAKAEKLIQALRAEAASTPFEESDILEAGKRLLRSTGSNIDLNRQLVKQAETLAALNPERTVTDAAEAILDAQLGEFERLKEFSIKLSKGDIDKMKKTGEQLGDTAVRAIGEKITKLGADNLVVELGKSVRGRRSTLIDSFRKTFQEVGEQAFEEVGKGVDNLQEQLDALKADPQFREDMREVSKIVADAAKMAFELATKLPAAVRSIRDFVQENRNALELGAGLFAANKLSGGALGAGAFAVGRRALFGKGTGVGAAAAGLGSEGAPVFVTNWPGGMGGDGDFFSRQLKGKGAAGAGSGLTAAELASTKAGVGGGLVGAIGVGGVLGGAAILGSVALAVKALAVATAGTQAALAAQEARLARGNGGSVKTRADRAVRESAEQRRRSRTGGLRSTLDEAFMSGDLGGSAGDVKRQTLEALARGASIEDINADLAGFGIEAAKSRGGVKFRKSQQVSSRLKQLTDLDAQLQANPEAARQLFDEGKLKGVMEEAEGLKRVSGRAESLIGKLNKVDVSKIEVNVTIQGGGADAGQSAVQAVQAQKASLEKILTDLTVQEEANR